MDDSTPKEKMGTSHHFSYSFLCYSSQRLEMAPGLFLSWTEKSEFSISGNWKFLQPKKVCSMTNSDISSFLLPTHGKKSYTLQGHFLPTPQGENNHCNIFFRKEEVHLAAESWSGGCVRVCKGAHRKRAWNDTMSIFFLVYATSTLWQHVVVNLFSRVWSLFNPSF